MTTFIGDGNSRFPGEPFVLIGGAAVHTGAISLLHLLEESGHRVTLDPETGAIVVYPVADLTDGQQVLVEAFAEDFAILLGGSGGAVIH